jgi:hypothetical protein
MSADMIMVTIIQTPGNRSPISVVTVRAFESSVEELEDFNFFSSSKQVQ